MDSPDRADSSTPTGSAQEGRPRRVLIVEDTIRGLGGSYESLYLTAKGLDRKRYEPVVLFFQQSHFIEKLEACGVRVHLRRSPRFWETERYVQTKRSAPTSLPRRGFLGVLRRQLVKFLRTVIGGLPTMWTVLRLAQREKIDLLHANNNLRRDTMVILAGILGRVRVLVHERQIFPISSFSRLLSRWVRVLVCISDAVLQNSKEQRTKSRHCVRIHNAVDLSELREVSRELPPGPPRVGILGRVMPKKGQKHFVEAAARIREVLPETKFYIIGRSTAEESCYESDARARAEELGLADALEWTGYLEQPAGLVASLDVMVHAAIEPEPFGRVIIESLALGVPVVATNIGGPPEIIEDGVSGFLIPPEDPGAIAEKVLALLQDPALRERVRQASLQRVEECFAIDTYVGRIQAAYDLALARTREEESAALAVITSGAGAEGSAS